MVYRERGICNDIMALHHSPIVYTSSIFMNWAYLFIQLHLGIHVGSLVALLLCSLWTLMKPQRLNIT